MHHPFTLFTMSDTLRFPTLTQFSIDPDRSYLGKNGIKQHSGLFEVTGNIILSSDEQSTLLDQISRWTLLEQS